MEHEAKRHPLAVWLAVAALLLPFAYGLAIGPTVWLQGYGFIRPEVTRLLFAPLIWICDRVGPLNDLVNGYIDLWR